MTYKFPDEIYTETAPSDPDAEAFRYNTTKNRGKGWLPDTRPHSARYSRRFKAKHFPVGVRVRFNRNFLHSTGIIGEPRVGVSQGTHPEIEDWVRVLWYGDDEPVCVAATNLTCIGWVTDCD
jgi:hypothetical protein